MLKIEFWELRWQKFYNPGFSARQFHVLLQLKPLQLRVKDPFNGSRGGITQFRAGREFGSLVVRPELGGHKRVSERDFPAPRQKYFPPDTNPFVSGRSI